MDLITYLTRIRFGTGALAALGEELAVAGVARPMIVTDRGVVEAGLVERIGEAASSLRDRPVFDRCPTNPTEGAVEEAAARFREEGCDGIVALGGGSPIDLAKAVALRATHEAPLVRYAVIEGGLARIGAAKPPVLAVPTTAGTGSEVGRAALITLDDGRKLAFLSPHMIPNAAICDPSLTVGLPPGLTAATGMDALTHCIETFVSPRLNPPADAIALDGLGRVSRWIRRAVEDGRDLDARTGMMMAALEGGLTFQKGLGAVHGLSHALGGIDAPRLHHGTLNAVLLPAVLRFNAAAIADRLPALRRAMGLAEGADVADAVADLARALGLPDRLSAMGVAASHLDGMAGRAALDHCTATNPRPVTEADYDRLLRDSL